LLLVTLVAILLAFPAQALAAAPVAAPGDETAITVTLTDESNKDSEGNSTPVPGVRLVVSDGSGELGSAETDADGRAVLPVPGKGKYTVTLDEKTLPEGIVLDEDTANELTVTVRLDGPTNFALFPIGVEKADTSSFADDLSSSVVSGVKFGLIVALAALGLSLIFGATGLTNFSHGELVTLGGVATWFFDRQLGLPVIVAGVLAVFLGAGFGWAQDRALWRPLRSRGTGLIAMMIVSIGFGIFLRSIYQYFFGSSTKSLSRYTGQARTDYGIVSLADKEIVILLVALVGLAVVCVALMKTRLGKAMRAVSDNPALAASSGMRVDGVIAWAWIVGTALAALSGVLLAVNSQVNFLMGFKMLLLIFAAVTLGGLGTIWGALIGSMVIGLMVEVGPLFGVPGSIKEVGALVVLILILLIRPQGILGHRERIG
jgi:branched-chain amino acid transport system permease protein